MVDRVVEDEISEVPEIDETLESVLLYALGEAKKKLEEGEDVVPFTALAVKETLFMETHPAETPDESFNAARHTVQGARGADAYAFCYDGYVDTDAGTKDALIAEGGIPGLPVGYAIGYLYEAPEEGEGDIEIEAEPVYIGPAPNFMEFLIELDDEEGDEDAFAEDAEDETEAPEPVDPANA